MGRKKSEINWVGVRAFARHRGVKQGSVTDRINDGTLNRAIKTFPSGKKRINQDLADKLWDQNSVKIDEDKPVETPPDTENPDDPKNQPTLMHGQ